MRRETGTGRRGIARGLSVLAAAAAFVTLVAPRAGAVGESARALVDRGVAAYERGEYPDAIDAFSAVLAQGVDDPVVHYDLGNAYFKAGRLGPALLHWRRAHALAPRDEDVAANLEYGRFLALDRVEEEGTPIDRKVEGWIDRITPEEAFRVASALWLLTGIAAVLWQLSPRGGAPWRRLAGAFVVLWALGFAGAVAVERRTRSVREAVVIASEAEVHGSPSTTAPTAFVLHEGAEVVVEGERGGWTEISLAGDLRGWIPSERIARI
jgi:hypothetical protein